VVAVVRESLTNVAKHSRAEKVDVRATVAEGWVTIEISDDGDGFPADQHPSGQKPRRSGLANLGVRAQKRGGSFTFGSASGETVLVWKVPFDDALAAGNQ
jgi:signal transduction histidine kinase